HRAHAGVVDDLQLLLERAGVAQRVHLYGERTGGGLVLLREGGQGGAERKGGGRHRAQAGDRHGVLLGSARQRVETAWRRARGRRAEPAWSLRRSASTRATGPRR